MLHEPIDAVFHSSGLYKAFIHYVWMNEVVEVTGFRSRQPVEAAVGDLGIFIVRLIHL